jgi:hypothetical protein
MASLHPFLPLRQLRSVFSYRTAECPPMLRKTARPQNGTIPNGNTNEKPGESIMMRSIPTTLTALQLALAAAATWLVYETNTLQNAAVLMFH